MHNFSAFSAFSALTDGLTSLSVFANDFIDGELCFKDMLFEHPPYMIDCSKRASAATARAAVNHNRPSECDDVIRTAAVSITRR